MSPDDIPDPGEALAALRRERREIPDPAVALAELRKQRSRPAQLSPAELKERDEARIAANPEAQARQRRLDEVRRYSGGRLPIDDAPARPDPLERVSRHPVVRAVAGLAAGIAPNTARGLAAPPDPTGGALVKGVLEDVALHAGAGKIAKGVAATPIGRRVGEMAAGAVQRVLPRVAQSRVGQAIGRVLHPAGLAGAAAGGAAFQAGDQGLQGQITGPAELGQEAGTGAVAGALGRVAFGAAGEALRGLRAPRPVPLPPGYQPSPAFLRALGQQRLQPNQPLPPGYQPSPAYLDRLRSADMRLEPPTVGEAVEIGLRRAEARLGPAPPPPASNPLRTAVEAARERRPPPRIPLPESPQPLTEVQTPSGLVLPQIRATPAPVSPAIPAPRMAQPIPVFAQDAPQASTKPLRSIRRPRQGPLSDQPTVTSEPDPTLAQTQNAASRPVSPRIPVAPLQGPVRSTVEIIDELTRDLGASSAVQRLGRRAAGTYDPRSGGVTLSRRGDIDTAAHEIAGHLLDDRFRLNAGLAQFDNELIPAFAQHGSSPPTGTPASYQQTYRRAEGVAEWMAAWMANPAAAEAAAPGFAAHFHATIPAATRNAVRRAGDAWRARAGADSATLTGAQIRMSPQETLQQKLTQAVEGDQPNAAYNITALDRIQQQVFDRLGATMKGIETAKGLTGANPDPRRDPRHAIRLWSHVAGKVQQVMRQGIASPLDHRTYTRTEGGYGRMLGFLDNSSPEALDRDAGDVMKLMVSQRTVDLFQRARATNLSGNRLSLNAGLTQAARATYTGAGAGTDRSDVKVAMETIRQLRQTDPARFARLEQGAKAYRDWSDGILQYLEDSGRISRAQRRQIQDANPHYVDFHRVLDDIDALPLGEREGGKLGHQSELMKRIHGSAARIENPYVGLMQQTYRAIREADRNSAMRSFVDLLSVNRHIHDPATPPAELANIGRKVPAATSSTVTVFRHGKPEYWELHPDIAAELKGWTSPHDPDVTFMARAADFIRGTITKTPGFAARNFLRDLRQRLVMKGGFRETLPALQRDNPAHGMLAIAGGQQGGFYRSSPDAWYRELEREKAEILRRPYRRPNLHIVEWGKSAWDTYNRILESTEKAGRTAEFIRAREAYIQANPHGLTGHALETAADKEAALQATEMLDFSQGGITAKGLSRYLLFLNANIQGTRQFVRAVRQDPRGVGGRWLLLYGTPAVAAAGIRAAMGPKVEQAYEQLSERQKDLYDNIPLDSDGKQFLVIPRSYESGILAGAADRLVQQMKGDRHAWEGYVKSLTETVVPVSPSDLIPSAGVPIVEGTANRDLFRERSIKPAWDEGKALELRDTSRASRLGQGIQSMVPLDARVADHLVGSYLGDFGRAAQAISDLGRPDRMPPNAKSVVGTIAGNLVRDTPTYGARDVQWVMDEARRRGLGQSSLLKPLKSTLKAASTETDREERQRLAEAAWELAARLRSHPQLQGPIQKR